MKAIIVINIIIISICFAQNTEVDSLNICHRAIGFDKIQHTVFSCLWTLSSQYVLVNKSGFSDQKALSFSVWSGALLGITKELNDVQTKERPFNWGDLIANGVGIGIAVYIIAQ